MPIRDLELLSLLNSPMEDGEMSMDERISRNSLELSSFENRNAAAVIFNEDALSRCSRVSVEGYNTFLPEDCIRIELFKLFGSCGRVSNVETRRDPVTNLIDRCAIVYLKEEGAKEHALSLDGCDMGGWFAVIKSLPKTECRFNPNQVAQLRAAYDRIYDCSVGISVEGYQALLPEDDVKDALIKHFCSCGEMVSMSIFKRRNNSPSQAMIFFCEPGAAERALALSGSYLGKRKIVVKALPEPSSEKKSDPYGRFCGSTVRCMT